MNKKVLALAVILLFAASSLLVYFVIWPWVNCEGSPESSTYSPSFSFDYGKALNFYIRLSTPTGLLARFPGDTSIYLADDQALDYNALNQMYTTTGNSTASFLAEGMEESIGVWGGFFKYYNPVFEVIGKYPNTTAVMSGEDITIGASQGFTINATEFMPNHGFNYKQYADLLAYNVLFSLHRGKYCFAESSFNTLSAMWDGHGLADQAFRDQNNEYQSYKLALYLIAWKALASEKATQRYAFQHEGVVQTVTSVMSVLQCDLNANVMDGGVWTGYEFNGTMIYGPAIPGDKANGETTSLFVLAGGNITP